MLAQWISWAYRTGFTEARREPLITLGSAPLEVSEFRSIVLGQLGESRLVAAIDSDISSDHSHAKALDADTKGALKGIHRRVGAAILFESSGGQIDKVAHLPELRFALGEPEIDTTSVDNAAFALEDKSYFIRRVGSDGFKISHQPTMKKVVNDRKASLDEDSEIKPTMRAFIQKEFERGRSIPMVALPVDGTEVQDSPKLTLVVAEPDCEWTESGTLRQQIAEWTKMRGKSPRLYPGSLVWCLKKPGRDLRNKVELWLAWKRVAREVAEGTLGGDFEKTDRADLQSKVADAEEAVRDEVWGGYRYVVIADNQEPDGLKQIDLGAGHSSGGETLCGRVIAALKSHALLNESVGAGYIERNWPPALKADGAWPLASLRQSFLNGSLTRLIDPDAVLRGKINEFVAKGEFGLGSGRKAEGGYERVWFEEPLAQDEVVFEPGVFLLLKAKARELKGGIPPVPTPPPDYGPELEPGRKPPDSEPKGKPEPAAEIQKFRISGFVAPELWNRLGTKIIPKLRSGADVSIGVQFTVTVDINTARNFEAELKQIIEDLGLTDRISIEIIGDGKSI
jgi:hypothetical protein